MVAHTRLSHIRCMLVTVGLIATCLSSALAPLDAYADVPPLDNESVRVVSEGYGPPLCNLCGASATKDTLQSFDSVSVCTESPGGVVVSSSSKQGRCRSIPALPYPVGIELIARKDGSLEVTLGRLNSPGQGGSIGADLIDSAMISPPIQSQRGGSPGTRGAVQALLTRQLVAILPLGRDHRFDSEFCALTLASAVAAVTLEACLLHPGSPLCRYSSSLSPSTNGLANGLEDSTPGQDDLCPLFQMRTLCARAVPPEPQKTASNLSQALQRTTEESTWGEFWWSTYVEFGSCGLVQYDPKTRKRHWVWNPTPGTAKNECLIQEYSIRPNSFFTCVEVMRNGCGLGECCKGADREKSGDRICEGGEGKERIGFPRPVRCVECKRQSRSTQTHTSTTSIQY